MIINNITPTKTPTQDQKIHQTAEKFVGTFYTQMFEGLFQETNESSEGGFEMELYSSFLAEAMAAKVASSPTAKDFVTHMENQIRRQYGLEEKKKTSFVGTGTYKNMTQTVQTKQGAEHVRTTPF